MQAACGIAAMNRWSAWICATAIGFAAAPAHATCVALGLISCSGTVSAAPLPFGNYDPNSGTARDVSGSITVTSTAFGVGLLTTIGYTISLNDGVNGSVAARKMVSGSAATPLGYNLFTNNNYDQVWGNESVSDSFTVLATVIGTSLTRSYTVYGRIPPKQYVSVGAYADTITVTVNY
jgi:spore coat protein U-like protein